ncbi:MAG: hypothetical protein HFI57_08920 [Lachnospiraceae bacterium]|nr:hypothetical protein [Lachnospiraceae bacterium]
MKALKKDRAQQELLEIFFREWTAWCPEHVIYQFCAVVFIGISMILSIVPCQLWDSLEDAGFFAWITLYQFGILYYLQKYNNYKEGGKVKATYYVLQYLPVSRRQFYLFQIRKVWKLCGCLACISIFCQMFCAGVFMNTFSVENILLPLGINLILPMLIVLGISVMRM